MFLPNVKFNPNTFSPDKILENKISENYSSMMDHMSHKCHSTYDNRPSCDNRMIDNNHPSYDKIPEYYSYSEWIKKTNLHCWNCTLQIDKTPVFIPTEMKTLDDDSLIFKTHGIFCSFSCAYGYLSNANNSLKFEQQRLLCILYKTMNNINPVNVYASPDKSLMLKFGGSLTELEYKKLIESSEANWQVSGIFSMQHTA
jgi:hypothetical protein